MSQQAAFRQIEPAQMEVRLRRIEGQIAGVRRMLDVQRPCQDVLDQIAAVRASLRAVAEGVAMAQVRGCLEELAIEPGRVDDRLAEVVAIMRRMDRWPA